MSPLPPSGTLLAGRFLLQQLAGRGGMGSVFRAVDTTNDRPVAVKLMHAAADSEAALRFTREARLLSELRHPGIVSYVAHGVTEEGQPFLAMEWLEGEDLARRLAHRPLSLSETLLLVRRIAEGLATAHARGIVHRDLKPSNLFLRGGRVEDVVLLDFGLARLAAASQVVTGSATVLGTPGYMAPEQASAQQEISPSADVFSLGCVLYECLTGEAPFRAPHLAAVLVKILFSEPARLRMVRPELPASLQQLVDQMLMKEPARRLADAAQVLRALEQQETPSEVPPPGEPRPPVSTLLSHVEQHLVSMLLATPHVVSSDSPTLGTEDAEQARQRLGPMLQMLQTNGAQARLLADGSLLATFLLERGTATDQAAVAAHAALLVKEQWPDSLVVLATGLSLRGQVLPTGEVMDRAGNFLRKMERRRDAADFVLLDETTAGLLGPRFQLDRPASLDAIVLLGEHLSADESRPLLGLPTPCVGREQELAMLEMAFTACVEDTAARALLVTAPAGTGKSRLRHEFLRRLEQRGQPMLVLLGRGDPMNAGSAYGLLGEAVRRLCGVLDGEPLELRRQKLARRVRRYLLPEAMKDTIEFLGELCGVAFPLEDSPKLRAAREEPQMMNTQVTRAMLTFLQAELSQGPVLLVLEDLHWGDASTVRLVEEVLRELSEQPFIVLALARPEIKELLPGLWARHLQEVPLRGLSQKACARLVSAVLGPQVPEAVVARLVEQAAGNALFLEELIRNHAEGRGEETPSTVLAMLQFRLQRLEPGLRHVLLAGSVFGRAFWSSGVRALLEQELTPEELERSLQRLSELEMIQRQAGSRFPGEIEYRFRHALVRDAAYSLVPGPLKAAGHRQAGAWLEQSGEGDPWVLAEHYQLGQEKERAVHFFTRAGWRHYERQDMVGARRCMEAALTCEPTGQALAELRVLEVMMAFWEEDLERLFSVGEMVRTQLVVGSAPWARVIGGMILMAPQCGRHADVARLGGLLLSATPAPEAATSFMETASLLSVIISWCGLRLEALSVLGRVSAVGRGLPGDTVARAWTDCTQAWVYHFVEAYPWQACRAAEQSVRAFREVNSERNRTLPQSVLGMALEALGELPRAIEELRDAAETSRRAGQTYAAAATQSWLILALASSPEPAHQEESCHMALRQVETSKDNLLHLGVAHLALAKVKAARRELAEAEEHARKACEMTHVLQYFQLTSRTLLSTLLREQGRAAEARAEAEVSVAALERNEHPGAGVVEAWLALAEACLAQGDMVAGDRALRQAARYLYQRAEDVPQGPARERFLSQVPSHARIRELSLQRWGKSWQEMEETEH